MQGFRPIVITVTMQLLQFKTFRAITLKMSLHNTREPVYITKIPSHNKILLLLLQEKAKGPHTVETRLSGTLLSQISCYQGQFASPQNYYKLYCNSSR